MKKNVLQLLEDTALAHPKKLALVDENRSVSYEHYIEEAKRIGSFLASCHQTSHAQPIIVLVDRRVDTVIAFMGVLFSGHFYVPVDNKTPLLRLKNIVDVLNPIAIIGFNAQEEKIVAQLEGNVPYYDFQKLILSAIDIDLLKSIRKKSIDLDPAYAIFTSGSTGVPKAVAIAHRSVIDLAFWLVDTFSFKDDDVLGNQTPFYFDGSVKDIYISIMSGACLVVIPPKCFSFPQLLRDLLVQYNITTLLWATSAVVMTAKSGILEDLNLPTLKRLFFAGEAMYGKHLNIWKHFFPNCMYINLYGPTEVTVDSTYYIVNRDFQDHEVVPIGNNCDNKAVFLLNETNEVILGQKEGELAVRGSGVSLGYYNNPEQTEKVFIQNPLHNHFRDILYKTGDFVKINDRNEIEFVGRKDFQVKHMGNRIELGEIEAAAYAISEIKHVACVYDYENEKIIMFYTAEEEIKPSMFLKALSASIPKYMYPNKFIRLSNMPLNANSKIDRKAIKLLINEVD